MSAVNTQILFIDSRVANIDGLLAQIDPGYEVVLLNGEEAGLNQIANALQGRTGIEALHVLSHGGPGYLSLGSGALNIDRLGYDYNLDSLTTISQALSKDADILLYGCDVAAGDAGRAFIDALAIATGADVAASTNVTGAEFLGGDWVLEAATGEINTATIELQGFEQTLGASVSYSFSGASGSYSTDAIMTATGVTFKSGGTLNVTGWDVDYDWGERDALYISYNEGANWTPLINTYGDKYLRGYNNQNFVTTYTIPNFELMTGTTLKLKVDGEVGGWLFRTSATTLNVFTNVKPNAASSTVNLDEDGRYTFSSGAFGFNDPDNDSFVKLKITSLPSSGTLTLNGGNVSSGQEIAAGSLSGLRYTPVANYFGTTSFGFQVFDGYEWSASTYTMTAVVNSVNDVPTLSNSVVLMPMVEDQVNNPGVTLLSKLGTYFSDVESGSMSGVVVTGTTADPSTEGTWEFFAAGSWQVIDAAVVSATNGLALSASTLIRFNPVANYSGTPPTLSLVATDGNFTLASYATGAAVAGNFVNTQTAPSTAGLSTVPRTVGIIVLPSNDPPEFNPSSTITGGVQDTYIEDTANTLLYSAGSDSAVGSHTLTGTISATDPETPANQLVYSIRGGEQTAANTWKLQGLYGVLTLNTTTKTWVYTPNKFDAINALPADATVHDLFDFKVVDTDGAGATRALDVTITGTNDVPLLNAAIANQSFNGAGNWSFQVPAESFVDAEGLGLTYSATLDSGAALPAWLNFDPATRTFTGNPPASANSSTLSVRVNARDTGTDSHVLIDVANDAAAASAQTFSIQIGAITVAPVSVTGQTTGAGLATAIQTAIRAADASLSTVTATYANGVLTITDPGKQEIANASLSNGATQIDSSIEYVNATISDVFVLTLGNNLNDAPTGAVTITGAPTQGQTLTANSTLADADTLGAFTYTWYANGVAINGQTGSTLTLGQDQVGKSISVEISYTDGGSASEAVFSAQTARVANIDDAPTSTDDSVTTLEDTAIALKLSDFGTFADVDGDTLAAIKITQLPAGASGTLTLNGNAVAANDQITADDIANGKLVFTPAANYYGAPTIGFQVGDGSLYGTAKTLTVNVTGVNDPGVATLVLNGSMMNGNVVDADGGVNITGAVWMQDGVVGVRDSQGNLPAGKSTYIKIDYTDAAGNAQTVYTNPVMPVDSTAVTGNNAPTLSAPATAFTLTEADLTANGGTYLSLAAANMTASDSDASPQNFANGQVWFSIQTPDSSTESLTLSSNGAIAIVGSDVQYNSTSIGTINSELNGSSGRTLEVLLNGSADNASVSALLAAVRYGNTSTNPAATRLIDVTVLDNASLSATQTITVNITPTNTPPASTSVTTDAARGVAKVLTLADFGNFTDLENGPFNYVIITHLPNSGTLTLNNGTSDVDMATLTFSANMQATYPGTSALTGGVTGYWIPVSDIVAGKLKYTAAANSGNSVSGLQFYVEENPISTSANTVTFQLSNTPPAATGAALTALTGTEDTVQTISTASLTQGYTDADGNTLSVANISANSGTIVDDGAGGFTYTPALNANGAVTLTYDIVDGFGGVVTSVTRTLNVAAVNDAVSVDAPLANLSATPGAALSINIGTLSPFYDPDTGDTLTYSATANGHPLSFYGLSIDASTGVISGNAPGSEPYLNFEITGTDAAGTSATSTFTLDLAGGSSSTNNQQYGLTGNNPGAVTFTGTATQGQTLTAQTPTDTDGMTASLATSVNVTTQGDATHNEVVAVTFGTKPSGVSSMTFAGVTVDLSTATTPAQVATAVTSALSGNATWTAVNNGNGSITLTSVAQAVTTDLQTSDFTGNVGVTYQWQKAPVISGAGTQVVTSVNTTTEGAGVTREVVVVTFNASGKPAGVYGVAFDGLGIDLTNASTKFDMAAAVANAINANPTTSNWTAVDNNDGTITLTADTVGTRTNLSSTAVDLNTLPNATLPSFVPLGAWTDVVGTGGYGTSQTLNILQQSESENFIRVQAFYTDAAGVAETPVSGVQFVVDADDAGTVAISGMASPGYTLTGVLSDADGISSSNPSYQWQSASSANGPWSNIGGATASTYTVQTTDANKYLRVNVTTYTDNAGYTQTNTYSGPTNLIQLGNVAPVAADDTVTLTEHSGLENATVNTVSPYVGNLLTNDSDLNGNNTMSVDELRFGATAGSGTLATSTGGGTTLTYIGLYGTLVITKATGAYTYELDQNNATVQALQTGQQLIEEFNYRVTDSGGLTDRAVLTIYIDGANDLPTITGTIPATKDVTEDVPALLDLSSAVMSIVDVDGPSVTLQLSVANGTLRVDTNVGGLTVTGVDTDTLTITASSSTALMTWLASNDVYYLTGANANGSNYDTLTYQVSDDGGNTYTTAGTTAISAAAVDDALIVDAGGDIVTDGAPNVTEVLDITLLPVPATASNPTPLIFDGVTLNLTPGMTVAQIGQLFAAASFPNWTASVNADGTVRLTAATAGASDNLNASSFTTTGSALSPYVVTPAGNDNVVTFKPRGEAVLIGEHLTLSDVDGGDIASVTLSVATGVRDNQFGVAYETLSLTATGDALATAAGIAVTVTPSANGYVLTLIGNASAADYQSVLREVLYEDANPNAFAGDRTVTISATDASGNVSNTASIATVTPLGVVLPGQRIFINGTDTGAVVVEVTDSLHFVASHAFTVAAGDNITFYDTVNTPLSGNTSSSAVVAAPLVSTVTVHVPWTPAIDNNGIQTGTDLTRTYYERSAPVAIATADASMTDQDGLIRNLTITLTNPQDNGATVYEYLTAPTDAILKWLSVRGITLVGNGTGGSRNLIDNNGNAFTVTDVTGATQFVFTATGSGTDATNFQVALRGVGYQNMDHDPTTNVQRIVNVTSTDVDGNVGVDATTYINVGAVNSEPAGTNHTAAVNEDNTYTFAAADFGFTDPLDTNDGGPSNNLAAVKLSTLPSASHGVIQLNGTAVSAGALVSVSDINAGNLTFVPAQDYNGNLTGSFTFQVKDDGGVANGGQDLDQSANTYNFNIAPQNDAPVLTADGADFTGITEEDTSNAGQLVSDILGTITDVDDTALAHSANNGKLTGAAIYSLSSGGVAGTWQYKLDADQTNTWVSITSITTGKALLLGSADMLRFVPDAVRGTTTDSLTQPSISYYAWDQAVGTAGTELTISGNQGGTGTLSTVSDTVAIEVSDVNDTPTVTAPGATVTLNEDNTVGITGVSFGDVDITSANNPNAASQIVEVTLSVAHGTIALATNSGVTVTAGADQSGSMTITGTLADVNTAVATLTYVPGSNYNGNDTLQIDIDDQGNVGGGALTATGSVAISVTPVNDRPVLTATGTTLTTVTENATNNAGQTVASFMGTFTDVDSGASAANNGTGTGIAITATSLGDLGGHWEYSTDNGASWNTITLANGDALPLLSTDKVRYVPDSVGGTDANDLVKPGLSYRVWDTSVGTNGTITTVAALGGSAASSSLSSASDSTVNITVTDVNDEPTIAAPATATVAEDGSIGINGVSFGDLDITGRADGTSSNDNVTVTLSVSHGTITLADTADLTFDGGTSDGSASMTFTGSLSAVNAAVATLTYVPTADFEGSDQLSIHVDDLGNVGGTALTADQTINLTVTGVNDAPVLTAADPTQALPTITEDDTGLGNTGALISALVGAGASQTGIADADTPNGANGSEAIGQGVAIYSLTVGSNGTGTWQYKLGNGAWQNAGVVDSQNALLLGANDSIRFLPDAENSTTGAIEYRLWDGASGAAGNKVDVTTNGGTTAFSADTDSATITVTDINDAPTVTINGAYSNVYFGAMGAAVDVFAPGSVTLGDVDIGDRVTSATVTIDSLYDLDNDFGTTYEYLTTTELTGEFVINGNTIIITGNGGGADGLTEATELYLDGAASLADYEAALATIQYQNTNPNAYAGPRPILLQITDDGDPDWAATDTVSNTETVTVNVNWGPVVDMSGVINADRDLYISYAEGDPAVLISASNAEIKDLDGNIASVTVTLTNPLDTSDESIFISDATALLNAGITATVAPDGHSIVLTPTSAAGLDGTKFQLALRTIKYQNLSESPTADQRDIEVTSVDVDGNPGLLAHTYINVSGTNDAPVLTAGGLGFNTITEDATDNSGQLVSDIMGTTTDVDRAGADGNSATNGILDGIAIHALGTGDVSGTWQYKLASDVTSTWVDITAITSGKALLLGSTDSLRFVPDTFGGTTANNLVKPSISYYAWDQAVGTAGTELTIATNQGQVDSTLSAAVDTVEIAITDVNDAPVITAPTTATVLEDGSIGITGVSIADVDVTNRTDGDTTNNNVRVTLSVSHGTITLASTAGLTVNSGADASATMTITGSLSDVNTAVATLTYDPTADYNGTDALTIDVNDLGNVGGAALDATQQTINITVTGVNDAPVLTDGTPTLTSIDENAETNTGTLVSALVGAGGTSTGIADADGLTAEGTEAIGKGIAVYGLSYNYNGGAVAGGIWQYQLASGSWTDVGVVDSTQALLLESTSGLRFVPDAENGGTGTVNFYLWDGASGTAGSKVDVSPANRGGTTAFSTVGDQATISVADVNDNTVVLTEDLAAAVTELGVSTTNAISDTGTITFSDVDWSGLHSLASSGARVTNTTLTPGGTVLGTLALTIVTDSDGGNTGELGWTYSVADNLVEYLKAGETKVEEFTINLYDDQGATTTRTVAVTITGTNDAPVIGTNIATGGVTELVTPSGNLSTGNTVIGFTDVDLTDTHTITSTSPITGQGVVHGAVTASVTTDTTGFGTGGEITWDYTVAASAIEYLSAGETKVEQFDIVLDDNNDGLDLQARRVSVTLTGTNDAPIDITVAGSDTLSLDEIPGAINFLGADTTVAHFSTTDVDHLDTHIYTIVGGADAQFFQIVNGNELQLRQLTPLDAEVKREFVVTVRTDDGQGGTFDKSFTITINDLDEVNVVARNWLVQPQTFTVNGTPTAFAANSLPEHDYTGLGIDIGVTAVAEDADATTNVVTYALVSDATGNAAYVGRNGNVNDVEFIIDANTGRIDAVGNLDYETEGGLRTLYVKARSQDGSSVVSSITLNIANVDEVAPTFNNGSTATAITLVENSGAGQVVYTAQATDTDFNAPNTATSLVYTLDQVGDYQLFQINQTTGAVTLIGNPDYETKQSYSFTVRVRDADGNYTTQAVSLAVSNLNDNAVTAVSDSNGAANTVAENAAVGTVVGLTASASDADIGAVLTYSLSDDASGKFAIDATTGVVTVADALDHETAASHNITVVASSSDGSTSTSQTYTIAVTNVNDNVLSAVTDSNTEANSLAENATIGAALGITAHATDADTGAVVTYSLTDDAGGKFAIDAATGVVTLAGALNFETAQSHTITVQAASSDGSTSTSQTFTIAVTNVNDNNVTAVTDTNASAESLAEDAAVGSLAGITAQATDADTGAVVTYSLSDNAGGKFAINSTTGVVTLASALDYETATSHTITVVATSSDGSTPTSQNYTITVTNVSDNGVVGPVDTNVATNNVNENVVVGTVVSGLTIAASDADTGTTIAYSLTNDADGKFAIDATTGVVTVAGALDHETAASHTITVRALSSDGSVNSQDFTINVNNLNDNAVTAVSDSNGATNTVAENAAVDAVVGLTALASDADTGAVVTYSLSDSAGGKFAINTNTGVVTVAGALDYETATSHNITVVASSSDGSASTSQSYTIALTNVNDGLVTAVADTNGATNTVAENAAIGATVGITAQASDSDAGAVVTYSLSNSAGGKFAINANTGVVTVAGALDYETATSQSITVVASSSDGSAPTSQTYTIAVTNVNDNEVVGPADTNGGSNNVNENVVIGTVVSGLTIAASDADSGATIAYSLTDNAGGKFAIDAGTGVVTVAGALNHETAASHAITVQALSSDGSVNATSFTINVNNQNDAPTGTPYIAGTALQGSTLTIERNDLADEDGINASTFSYRWYANGVQIENENSAAITLKQDQVGKSITASISYLDNAGYTNTTLPTAAVGPVVDLNDAPTAVASTVSAAEDTAKILVAADFGFSDAVDAGGLGAADVLQSIRIESLPNTGTGALTLNGNVVTAGQVIPVSALTNSAVTGLVFTPVSNVNGPVSFTFSVQDNAGTANSGVDWSVSAATMTLNIAAVNDAPVLTLTAPALTSVNEDAASPVGAIGTLVSALVSGISDLDASAVKGIAITSANTSHGTYYYSLNNGSSWTAFPAVSSAASLLLAADNNTRVFFKPAADFNGSVSDALTIRAWDQTSGTAGSTANTTVNGGTTAFSASADSITLNVVAVNDAPHVVTPLSDKVITQGSSFNWSIAGQFADVDGDALTYTATLANGNPLPSWLNFDAAQLRFTGTPDAASTATIQVKVTARDTSGAETSDVFGLGQIAKQANFAQVAATTTTTGRVAIYGVEVKDLSGVNLGFTMTGTVNPGVLTDYLELVEDDANNKATVYLKSGVTLQSLINALGGLGSSFNVNTINGADTVTDVVTIGGAGSDIQTTLNQSAPVVTSPTTVDLLDGSVVYQVTATDSNGAGVLQYSLSGADAVFFTIDSSGAVRVKDNLTDLQAADYLSRSAYNLDVVVKDGVLGLEKTTTQAITLERPEVDKVGAMTVVATQDNHTTNNANAVVDVTNTTVAPNQLAAGMDLPYGKSLITATQEVDQGLVPTNISLYVDKNAGVNGFWTTIDGSLVNLATAEFGGSMTEVGTQLRIDLKIDDAFDLAHSSNFVDNGVVTLNGAAAKIDLGALGANPLQANDLFWS